MLIAFSGLPGTGKSTLARTIAARFSCVYLRIDTIEQAIRSSDVFAGGIGPAGYMVAYHLATENLRIGRSVVADCVNPLKVTRDAWADVAMRAKVRLINVKIICSDGTEHRRRVEQRIADIDGHRLPTWEDVTRLKYDEWTTPRILIDTAHRTIQQAQDELQEQLMQARQITL